MDFKAIFHDVIDGAQRLTKTPQLPDHSGQAVREVAAESGSMISGKDLTPEHLDTFLIHNSRACLPEHGCNCTVCMACWKEDYAVKILREHGAAC